MAKNLDKGGKASLPEPPETSKEDLLAQDVIAPKEPPAPEAKAFRCETCDSLFVPVGSQIVCNDCLAKLQANRVSSRAGYVRCKVMGDGSVVANGFVEDVVKTNFVAGDVAEFSQADVDSLPGRFERVV